MEMVPLSLSSKPTSNRKPSWVEIIGTLFRGFFFFSPLGAHYPSEEGPGDIEETHRDCQVDTEMGLALADVDRPLCWGRDTSLHAHLGLRTGRTARCPACTRQALCERFCPLTHVDPARTH